MSGRRRGRSKNSAAHLSKASAPSCCREGTGVSRGRGAFRRFGKAEADEHHSGEPSARSSARTSMLSTSPRRSRTASGCSSKDQTSRLQFGTNSAALILLSRASSAACREGGGRRRALQQVQGRQYPEPTVVHHRIGAGSVPEEAPGRHQDELEVVDPLQRLDLPRHATTTSRFPSS